MAEYKKAELKIIGMVCAACVSAIEKSLRSLDGVQQANVNLATEMAYVEYDPEKLKLADLEKGIRDAGYDVVDEKVVLKIGGMTCAMSVKSLEIAFKKLDGVVEANVNLAAEKAYITYNPRITSLDDLKKAVEDTGYQYLGIAGEETTTDLEKEASEKDLKDKFRRMVVGFGVSTILMGLMYLPLDRVIPMEVLMAVPMGYLMLDISILRKKKNRRANA